MPATELLAEARIGPTGVFSADNNVALQSLPSKMEWPLDIQFGGLLEPGLSFRNPLRVSLYKDEESYVARCIDVEQFGYGSNLAEALDDLGRTVSEMYVYLSDAEESGTLGEALLEQFVTLGTFIERRDTHAKRT